ncbi:MAG: hypothetical protein QM296_13630, partial [Bacillota bacterium]|nr:hypothetical protein [Bacillota bacterium]
SKSRVLQKTFCISLHLDHRRPVSGQDREFYKKHFVFLFILTTKELRTPLLSTQGQVRRKRQI